VPSLLDGLITRDDIAKLAAGEDLILDDDRIGVLEAIDSIDVQACPGSGKTTLIAAKLMLLAKKWSFEDRGICILSHTNVAKNEIICRLQKSKILEAERLLAYPHFIGTIQEFVGKYIAFPSICSKGTKINLVDTDVCLGLIYSKLQQRTRIYIDQKSQHSNVLYDFDLNFFNGDIVINVPTFSNSSNSGSYKDLLSMRKFLISEGYFFYRDIFAFSQNALFENGSLALVLQRRFPCIFLDEMQDTQKFQDELLSSIFDPAQEAVVIQRFGDPDQAIFQGIGSEEPNETFNGKSADDMDFVIHKSHRFTNSVAKKIAKLSFNEIPLESELSDEYLDKRKKLQTDGNEFENTIIIFDDTNISAIIPSFLNIVSQQFSEDYVLSDDFKVKIIGAVGNEITQEGQLKIGHYWRDFDKKNSVRNFRENTLIEAVRYCRQRSSLDWSENYKFLFDCIVRLLRLADIRDHEDKYFNATTLREHLIQKGEWGNFREHIYFWLNPEYEMEQRFWGYSNCVLINIFNLNDTFEQVREYIEFSQQRANEAAVAGPEELDAGRLMPLPDNAIKHPKGFRVELSTIHGVKGETHDAILVLETKNHCCDLETMLSYLIGILPNEEHPNTKLRPKPNSRAAFKPNQTFMRQFYVGMSRPKHLLGLAIHTNRISEEQKDALNRIGWKICDLTLAGE